MSNPDRPEVEPQSMDRGQRGFVDAFAEILADPNLRDEFKLDPQAVADRYDLDQTERNALLSLSHDLIKQQAHVLLQKRWHEVVRQIPKTISILGDQSRELFFAFASRHWPNHHLRHPLDAYRFLKFLKSNELAQPDRQESRKLKNWLQSTGQIDK